MAIISIDRPAGASTDYQFFKNSVSNVVFKVKAISVPTAAGSTQFGLCVTTSQIDASGNAITENGQAVIDSWTHTLTDAETSVVGFSLQSRISQLLIDRITALEALFAARAQLANMTSQWSSAPQFNI